MLFTNFFFLLLLLWDTLTQKSVVILVNYNLQWILRCDTSGMKAKRTQNEHKTNDLNSTMNGVIWNLYAHREAAKRQIHFVIIIISANRIISKNDCPASVLECTFSFLSLSFLLMPSKNIFPVLCTLHTLLDKYQQRRDMQAMRRYFIYSEC